MNPVYWLLIVIACAVLLCTVVAVLFYGLGWDRCDEHHAELDAERHRHREQDRMPGVLLELPAAGRLSPFPEPEPVALRQSDTGTWRFAGDWDTGPVVGEIVGNAATNDPCPCGATSAAGCDAYGCAAPPLSDTGEMRALTDARIAKWEGDTNEFIHSMPRAVTGG